MEKKFKLYQHLIVAGHFVAFIFFVTGLVLNLIDMKNIEFPVPVLMIMGCVFLLPSSIGQIIINKKYRNLCIEKQNENNK